MAIAYDEESGTLAIIADECECGSPWHDTGCDAPGCHGQWCPECGTGCDIEVAPEFGRCAEGLATESDEDYEARINASRAAFGLKPLDPGYAITPSAPAAPSRARLLREETMER